MAIAGNQELRTEVLSGSTKGKPIKIDADFTTTTDVEVIHLMSVDDVLDAIWLVAHNEDTTDHELKLVVAPEDTSNATNVADATLNILIPRRSSTMVLEGQRFRFTSGNLYTIGAHVATADIGLIRITGWITRQKSEALTP